MTRHTDSRTPGRRRVLVALAAADAAYRLGVRPVVRRRLDLPPLPGFGPLVPPRV